ncbi:condensin complex subunit 3 [Nilaparvata lugens]|uniref:condensin complex subunit 3 n=1 Tax=Nilaparvata lugens TaxID=108931 RepID=UPI00193D3970|nr:condensin complex subunit 3 [Nilaparvata lugens]
MSENSKKMDIFTIFYEAQLSRAYHDNYIKKLKKIYKITDDNVFMSDFLKCLKVVLVGSEKFQTVDLALDFIAKFSTSVDVSSEATSPFLIALFEFLFQNHDCSNTSVRFNVCRLINRIMINLGANASLEEDICERIITTMINRIQDTVAGVRVQAVLAINRLQDPSDENCRVMKAKVQECLKETLLPKWLKVCNDNFVNFVRLLNIQDETVLDVAKKCLHVFFDDREKLDLVEYMQGYLVDRTIPYNDLSPELVFVWRTLSEYLRSHDLEKSSDLLEQILPELTLLVEYIKGYSLKLSSSPTDDVIKTAKNKFVLQQLLEMTSLYELADEVGRLNLSQLCVSLLHEAGVQGKTACVVVDRLGWAIPDANDRILAIVEVISDLREPFMDMETAEGDLTQMRNAEVEKTQLRERLELLNREQNEAAEAEDFMVAKEIQLEIMLVERKLAELDTSASADTSIIGAPVLENIDPIILEKCLLIIREMVDNKDVTKMTPTLCSLLDNFIRPAFQKNVANPTVRQLSLELMGMFSLLDAGLARKQFIIFCFLISSGSTVALKIVFDMLLKYGLRLFNVGKPDDDVNAEADANTSRDERSSTENKNDVINLLASLLDCETRETRNITADGFCKLFLMGHLRSPKILASLIAIWFSPITAEDSEWRQRFGLFLSAFTVTYGAQTVLERAFLPTLQMLFNPDASDSQLADVDPDSVAQVFVKLTHPDVVSNKTEDSAHNRIALKILEEVSKKQPKNEKSEKIRVLMRTLTLLTIQSDDLDYLSDLISRSEKLTHKYNMLGDKTCYRLAVKFTAMVNDVKHLSEKNTKSEICNTLDQTNSKVSIKTESSMEETSNVQSSAKDRLADSSAPTENASRIDISGSEQNNESDSENSSSSSISCYPPAPRKNTSIELPEIVPCSDEGEEDDDDNASEPLDTPNICTSPRNKNMFRLSQAPSSDVSDCLSISSQDCSVSTRSSSQSVGARRSQRKVARQDLDENSQNSFTRSTRSARQTRRT